MAEPTLPASAWWPWVTGLVAAFLAAIGVSWAGLFWAMAGAFFGAGFAPPAGRLRAIAGFPLSVLLAAKAGVVWAAWQGPLGNLSPAETAQAAAAVSGLIFHPAVAALVKAVPAFAERKGGAL